MSSRSCSPRRRIQSFARTTGAKKEAKNRRERKKRAAAKKKIEQDEAALQLQCFSRVQAAKMEANERRKRKEAAVSTVWSSNVLSFGKSAGIILYFAHRTDIPPYSTCVAAWSLPRWAPKRLPPSGARGVVLYGGHCERVVLCA